MSSSSNDNAMSRPRRQQPPLPFQRWLAFRAYKTDLLLIVTELLVTSAIHTAKQFSTLMCVPAAGCALGRAFLDLHPPFDPAARRADALLAGFPCGESDVNKLLYTFRTGAVLDLWLRLRLHDLHNLTFVLAHLLALAIGIAAPSFYMRCRHIILWAFLLVISLLGVHLSTTFAPDGLFPLGAAMLLSSSRCGASAFYNFWKSSLILQLFVGPTMWLIFLSVTSAVDSRIMALPAAAGGIVQPPPPPRLLGPRQAVLLFSVIAVLPYLAARFYERHWLLPQYRAYLRSCGAEVAEGGVNDDLSGSRGQRHTAASCKDVLPAESAVPEPSTTPTPAAAGSCWRGHIPSRSSSASAIIRTEMLEDNAPGDTARAAVDAPAADRALSAPEPPAAVAAPPNQPPPSQTALYRSCCRTVVFNMKIPLPPGCSFDAAAARLSAIAVAKLNARLAAVEAQGQSGLAADLSSQPDGGGGDGGGEPADGTSRRRRRRNLLRLQSLVCVEGCVQLLAVVQAVGEEVPAEPSSSGLRSDRIHTRQVRLGLPAADALVNTADFNAALETLVDELEYGGSDGDDEAVQGRCPGGGAALPPLLWPPVLRRLDEASTAAGGIGGDGSGDGDTVLVLLPTGGTAVRCVVVGPVGRWQQQQQEVYLDEELQAEELLLPADAKCGDSQGEDGEGGGGGSEAAYRAVRIRLPPTSRAASGALSLHLLPPRAAAADKCPQITADDSSPPPPSPSDHTEPATSATAAAPGRNAAMKTAAAAAEEEEEDANVAAATTTTTTRSGEGSNWELLATLPLLVLPDDAAEELLVSKGDESGGKANVPDSSRARHAAELCPPSVQKLAATAAAAQHGSGLLSLANDMGCALGSGSRYGPAWPPPQQKLPTDPRVNGHLFAFLESYRMRACLRECRFATGAAAEVAVTHSTDAAAAAGDEGLATTAAPADPSAAAQAAARRDGGGASSSSGSLPPTSSSATTFNNDGDDDYSGTCATTAVADGTAAATAATAAAAAGERLRSPASGGSGGSVPGRRNRSEADVGVRRSGLRSLLFGFWPRDLESAYQDFKAEQRRQLDRAGLVMQLIIVTSNLMQTYSAAVRQPPPAPPAAGSGGGGGPQRQLYLPYLPYLHVLSQGIYTLVGVALPLLLAFVTTLHVRCRNRLLLLRALLDYGMIALILMPGPWGDLPLTVPDVWVVFVCRRNGLLLYRGVWEPFILQLSPHLAIWPALSSLVYVKMLIRPCFGGCWRPALFLTLCTSSCHLAISAATDAITRRKFLTARAAAAEAVRGGGGGGAVGGGHHQKQAARCCSDEE
ncbi:hypothetical protein PLESTB_001120000 [Pleodorina starrii]|uniref:Uncharacterized protein n=1 Tax=Pleodorina starrii TaxID=330485 RepID=A0A9W6BRG3_9CHLO|nr:hypothetical protein PLESTB_001120000 [Pleodorina starrii]